MRMKTIGLLTLVLALCACSDDSTTTDATVIQDSGSEGVDLQIDDTGPDQAITEDAGPQPDTGDTSEIENEFGFVMRKPQQRTLSCEPAFPGGPEQVDFMDTDWICTFDHGGKTGYIYVQATPTGCASGGMSSLPTFDGAGWISIGGAVSGLSDVYYDYGGNHNNDELGFAYNGAFYRYYHSSFGFGWRACQPMDCMIVLDGKGGTVLEDGCTDTRTLPVVCLPVESDSTSFSAADFVDTFAKCPGDPNP
jgi:hypothetical protein